MNAPSEPVGLESVTVIGYRNRKPGETHMSFRPEKGFDICDPLMAVAQHSRIVAAKDAEIARLHDLHAAQCERTGNACDERDELRAQLAAQPAAVPVAWTWQGVLDELKGHCPEGVTVFPHQGPGVPIPLYTAPMIPLSVRNLLCEVVDSGQLCGIMLEEVERIIDDWPAAPAAPQQGVAMPVIRDWAEDFAHENGNYMCRCSACGNTFSGHKRRILCKLCAHPAAPQQGEDSQEAMKQSEALAWKALEAASNILDRRACPHAWLSELWAAGSKVIADARLNPSAQGEKP